MAKELLKTHTHIDRFYFGGGGEMLVIARSTGEILCILLYTLPRVEKARWERIILPLRIYYERKNCAAPITNPCRHVYAIKVVVHNEARIIRLPQNKWGNNVFPNKVMVVMVNQDKRCIIFRHGPAEGCEPSVD